MKKEIRTIGEYLKERNDIVSTLSLYKNILRGTIVKRGNICGKTGCRCKKKHKPLLHGPYDYLSHRSRKKTQMIFLNKIKKKYAVGGIREYHELIDKIYRISEINFKILRYRYQDLDEKI
jgi:hypothetical protein